MQDVLNPLRDRNSYAVTADVTLGRQQLGDCLVHNTGATGTVIVTLPPGTAKMKARFLRTAAYTLTIDPNGTEIIKDASGTSLGAGVAKDLTADGAYCELEHDGVAWNVIVDRPAAVVASVSTAMLAAAAVTPPKMAFTGLKLATFTGAAGAGAITLTGAAVGDRVIGVVPIGEATTDTVTVLGTTVAQPNALFESAITVVNQIQQASATDLSDVHYLAFLIPASA